MLGVKPAAHPNPPHFPGWVQPTAPLKSPPPTRRVTEKVISSGESAARSSPTPRTHPARSRPRTLPRSPRLAMLAPGGGGGEAERQRTPLEIPVGMSRVTPCLHRHCVLSRIPFPQRCSVSSPPLPSSSSPPLPPHPALRGRGARRMSSAGSRCVCCHNSGSAAAPRSQFPHLPPATHWGVSGQRPEGSIPAPQRYGGRRRRGGTEGALWPHMCPQSVPKAESHRAPAALLPPPELSRPRNAAKPEPEASLGGLPPPPPSPPSGSHRGAARGGCRSCRYQLQTAFLG